jgi:hypothetical protein
MELNPLEPVCQFLSIAESSREPKNTTEGIEPPKTRQSALQTSTTTGISQKVEFIDYHPIHLRDPIPMSPPVSGAGVQPLWCHDHDPCVLVRDGVVRSGATIVPGEDTNRHIRELSFPT